MTRDAWEQCLGALCAAREARGDGATQEEKLEAMRGVLHVINNRHKTSGKGWEDEIGAKNQFSSMTVSGDSQTIWYPTSKDEWFDDVLDLATKVYLQLDPDPTGGAIFYYNPLTATSKWFQDKVVNSPDYEISVTIGSHVFYRKSNA